MMNNLLRVFFLLFLSLSLIAQERKQLLQELSANISDQRRIDIYNKLCDILWHQDADLAIAYSDSAYQLVLRIDYPEGEPLTYGNMGIAEYTKGNYELAEEFYSQAILKASALGLPNDSYYLYYFSLLKRQGKFIEITQGDSILNTLNINDQNYIDFLLSITEAYLETGNLTKAKDYIGMAGSLELGSVAHGNYLMMQSAVYATQGLYVEAVENLKKSIKLFESNDVILLAAKAYLDLGRLYYEKSDYGNARVFLEKSKDLYGKNSYPFGVAECLRNLGLVYSSIGELNYASSLLFEALDIFESQQNLNEIAKTYNELCWIYQSHKIFKKADEFIKKSLVICKGISNVHTQAYTYNVYGTLLYNQGDIAEALTKYELAGNLWQKIGYKRGIAISTFNIAYAHDKLGNQSEVLNAYLKAYEIEKEIGNDLGMGISEYTIGEFYTRKNKYELAGDYLQKSVDRLNRIKAKDNLINAYLFSAQLYEKSGQVNKAFKYYKQYVAVKDSVFTEAKNLQLAELEARYNLKNKEKEIDLLNLENKNRAQELRLKEKTINNQKLLITAVVIGLLLVGFMFLLSYRLLLIRNRANKELNRLNEEISQKQEELLSQSDELQDAYSQISEMNNMLEAKVDKQTKEVKQAYKELDTFFYRSSHDFRRPLTTFLGLAEVAKTTLKDNQALELFDKVHETSVQMDKMVQKLRDFSMISSNSQVKNRIDFDAVISTVKGRLSHLIKKINVEFEYQVDVEEFQSYPDLIELILLNLVENSILYHKPEGTKRKVNLSASQRGGNVLIKVKDNGQGIEEDFFEIIFDMYTRANLRSTGNGLGLYIVKKAVERLKGEINLKSKIKSGTTFEILLPNMQ